jgi:TROVE domain
MVRANARLRAAAAADPAVLLDPDALRRAGMTWEDALSLAGPAVDKGALWTAMIPSMGYMALLRNLRNFDEAGVSDVVAATVAAKLADPGGRPATSGAAAPRRRTRYGGTSPATTGW